MVEGDFAAGLQFLFEPRFGELSSQGVLDALGHAFFTLSLGMGAVMAYGAYLPPDTPIVQTSVAVVLADTAVALLASLIIFPIVFANGLDPASGPGLVFQSLPLAFGQMAGGTLVAVLFFLLLTSGAWTSAVSLMEPAVAWLVESRAWTRARAAGLIGSSIWLLGILTVLSFGPLQNLRFLGGTFFDNLDYLSNNIMLPFGGLAITIFAGWVMARMSTYDELNPISDRAYRLWRFTARYLTPLAVLLVFLHAIALF
jgi:NSS family neurotransmitter:Na+ symporter